MSNPEHVDRQPQSPWDRAKSVAREIWHFGGPDQSERAKRFGWALLIVLTVLLLIGRAILDAAAGKI